MALLQPSSQSLTILSWNTLCYEDPWFDGWGCPLEIQRRDAMMQLNKRLFPDEVQHLLTKERYGRIRNAMLEEVSLDDKVDVYLLQELTHQDPWDDDDEFAMLVEPYLDRVACQDDYEGNLQRVYIRKDSGWKAIRSYGLETDVLEGGCLVELVYWDAIGQQSNGTSYEEMLLLCGGKEEEGLDGGDCFVNMQNRLYLVNLHGKSGPMRDPKSRQQGMEALWKEMEGLLDARNVTTSIDGDSWQDRLVMCGDWNTHLTDLPEAFPTSVSSLLIPALLDNQTHASFSTDHEAGFLAQYDGCLLASSRALQWMDVSNNIHGFMPKGQHGTLTGDFSYVQNEGVFLGDTLEPGTLASDGLSDHLRIYTSFSVAIDGP
jgi:hypothetical protein